VGGMTVGTLFTLLVVPALYLLLAKRHTVEHVEPPVMLGSRS
jgi:Cu/Ag efflux pump CusA